MCQIDRKAVLQLAGGRKKKAEREKNRVHCVINDWTRGLQGPQSLRRRSGEKGEASRGRGQRRRRRQLVWRCKHTDQAAAANLPALIQFAMLYKE